MSDTRLPISEQEIPWYEDMTAPDALLHIANALHSLLYGVQDEETLAECQAAADVWMKDAADIARREALGA